MLNRRSLAFLSRAVYDDRVQAVRIQHRTDTGWAWCAICDGAYTPPQQLPVPRVVVDWRPPAPQYVTAVDWAKPGSEDHSVRVTVRAARGGKLELLRVERLRRTYAN